MWKIYSRVILFNRSVLSAGKTYWSFNINRLYLLISFLLQVGLWWWAINIYSALADDFLIFHYTVDFGIDLVGFSNLIFILPALALFFTLINLILALLVAEKKIAKLLWHLLGSATVLVNFFILLSLFSVYLINFRS